MKKLIFFILAALLSGQASLKSQTVVTVGGTSPNYLRLAQAFNAINNGLLTGTVIIKINGNTVETSKASLGYPPGLDTLIIYPTVACQITGNMNDNLVEFGASRKVLIDGRVNQAGTSNSLTIINTNTGSSASTVCFRNNAKGCAIRNCNLQGSGPGVVYFYWAYAGSFTGVNGHSITWCNISDANGNPPAAGILGVGNSSYDGHVKNTISNNNIFNYFSTSNLNCAGIYLSHCEQWTITANSFYQTAARSSNAPSIWITEGSNYTITHNMIGGSMPGCAGTPSLNNAGGMALSLDNLNSGYTGTTSTVSNNTITNIKADGFCGISLNSGKANISYNQIGDTLGLNAIVSTGSLNSTTGIYSDATNAVNIFNNSIGGISAAGRFAGIEGNYGAGIQVYNNTIGSRSISNNIVCGTDGPSPLLGISGSAISLAKNNFIGNLKNVSLYNGNSISGISISGSVTSNEVTDLYSTNTTSTVLSQMIGISASYVIANFVHDLRSDSPVCTVFGLMPGYQGYNNVVSLGFDISSETQYVGAYMMSSYASFYHNTMSIGGTNTGNPTFPSSCYQGTSAIKNNIFVNQRNNTVGGSKTYCVYVFNSTVMDLNDYYFSGSGTLMAWHNGNDYSWLPGWNAVSYQNGASTDINPLLINPGNSVALSYKPGTPVSGAAIPSFSTAADYYGFARANPPTMGAIEWTSCVAVPFTRHVNACTNYTLHGQTYTTSGVYSQTLSYASGCDTLLTLHLTMGPPSISISTAYSLACPGSSNTLTASGVSTYTWASGPGGSVLAVSPSTNTIYQVSGTSYDGCITTKTVLVSVAPLPTLSLNSGSICIGSSFNFSPVGNFASYTLSGGSPVVAPNTTTSYTLTGMGANGCTNQAVATITVNALPTVILNSGSICTGNSFTLAPSGANIYTYTNGSQIVSPLATSSYTVIGMDADGCVSQGSCTVVVYPLPTLSVNSGTVCSGDTFTIVPSGGVTYTYSSGNNLVTPAASSSYSVTGSDANGCVSAAAVCDVSVIPLPSLTITATSTLVCEGSSQLITMTASGADSYYWFNASSADHIQAYPYVTDSYSLTGQDLLTGCTASASIEIVVSSCTGISNKNSSPISVIVYPNPGSDIFYVESPVALHAEITDMYGRLLKTEEISRFPAGLNLQGLPENVYFLTVTGANGYRETIKLIKN